MDALKGINVYIMQTFARCSRVLQHRIWSSLLPYHFPTIQNRMEKLFNRMVKWERLHLSAIVVSYEL